MAKFLPIGWFVLILVALGARLITSIPQVPLLGAIAFVTAAIDFFPLALLFGSFGLIYLVFNRTVNRRIVFQLGWLHLLFSTITEALRNALRFVRHQAVANGESLSLDQMVFWSTPLGIVSTLGSIALFAAVLAAYQDTRKRIELQTFD